MKRQPSEWEKIIANETTDKDNLQNIQVAHAAQYQKNKHHNPNVGKRLIKKLCKGKRRA